VEVTSATFTAAQVNASNDSSSSSGSSEPTPDYNAQYAITTGLDINRGGTSSCAKEDQTATNWGYFSERAGEALGASHIYAGIAAVAVAITALAF